MKTADPQNVVSGDCPPLRSGAVLRFATMGGHATLQSPDPSALPRLEAARDQLLADVGGLSRFRGDSELSRLNADPRETVPASPLLRAAVRAMVVAAHRSGGLVDPTLLPELEAAGYAADRSDAASVPLAEAVAQAPARRPARPHPDARWRAIRVDDRAGTITRPAGLRLDTGGSAKGLLADLTARRLWDLDHVTVDLCGDIRVAGRASRARPQEIEVLSPLTGQVAARLWLGDGAIATSGIDHHVWRTADGAVAHHLLDPSTGRPAWTGLAGVTAVAPTTAEAETLAKTALLSGPATARELLAAHGGVLFCDDGRVEGAGQLEEALTA